MYSAKIYTEKLLAVLTALLVVGFWLSVLAICSLFVIAMFAVLFAEDGVSFTFPLFISFWFTMNLEPETWSMTIDELFDRLSPIFANMIWVTAGFYVAHSLMKLWYHHVLDNNTDIRWHFYEVRSVAEREENAGKQVFSYTGATGQTTVIERVENDPSRFVLTMVGTVPIKYELTATNVRWVDGLFPQKITASKLSEMRRYFQFRNTSEDVANIELLIKIDQLYGPID